GSCRVATEAVRHSLARKPAYYPLFMHQDLLFRAIAEREPQNEAQRGDFEALKATLGKMPSDVKPNRSQIARILNSIPWAEGQEPFQSVVDARRILRQA